MKYLKLTAAMLMLGGMAFAGGIEAKVCKNYNKLGQGIDRSKNKAKLKARINWVKNVRRNPGPQYANWTRSYIKRETCSRLAGGKWRCVAKARPCRK